VREFWAREWRRGGAGLILQSAFLLFVLAALVYPIIRFGC
jgi:hypothetical protein